MQFIADFHVHSKFSRATARNLDLENLYVAAQKKGITVVGTGDFTHPHWFEEIRTKLVEAGPGLFRLQPRIADECDRRVPESCRGPVRFILTAEISNIYKKNGITRKNHNLIFMPAMQSVRKFNAALERIGNIRSDGRPILGLDARNLLELNLEIEDKAFLVPAHIWTPWFSLLGAKSGFDTIEECFGDLSRHVFALETGLSSDPPMNWRCSGLDGRTLISNSDAHSPEKLGREANIFNTRLDFDAIRNALCTGDPRQFEGTIEFYPEEGKYHLDGHRKCGIRMHPGETCRIQNRCPVCGKPLTLGVLHRVEQLADRSPGELPARRHRFWNLVPLKEILAEIFRVGPTSKRVAEAYETLLDRFGPEFRILKDLDTEMLRDGITPLLPEALARMRRGHLRVAAGFDGEFGKIELFDACEREGLQGQRSLFIGVDRETMQRPPSFRRAAQPASPISKTAPPASSGPSGEDVDPEAGLNSEQKQAVLHAGSPLVIVAGPGTGKTRTLTLRILDLIHRRQVPPDSILALTFTRKAAEEMALRLRQLLKFNTDLPIATTFHALCLQLLKEFDADARPAVIDDFTRRTMIRQAALQVRAPVDLSAGQLEQGIIALKQRLQTPEESLAAAADPKSAALASIYREYQTILGIQSLRDYEDLVFQVVERLEQHPELRRGYHRRFRHILVDEYQDLNYGQYRLVKSLAPAGADLFVIGDPDQAIYGFRGADVRYFQSFRDDYPDAREIRLRRNYRSTETILKASRCLMAAAGRREPPLRSGIIGVPSIELIECPSERSEAVAVGREIERLVGGTGFHSFDFGTRVSEAANPYGFGDIAVLFRTRAQGRIFSETLEKSGIPCQHLDATGAFYREGKRILLCGLNLIRGTGSYADLLCYSEAVVGGCSAGALQPFVFGSLAKRRSLSEALARAGRAAISGMNAQRQRKLAALTRKVESLQGRVGRQEVTRLLSELLAGLKPSVLRSHPALQDPDDIFFRKAREAGRDLDRFLLEVTLASDADVFDEKAQNVSLLTFHAAKGLEFPVVFITGCEEELLPLAYYSGTERETDIGEERRLLYVGMTRARQRLFFTWAKSRSVYGRTRPRRRSRFIDALPPELLRNRKSGQPVPRQRQLSLF